MAGSAALIRGLLARLRQRLAERPDTEHEQAIVRLVLGTLILAYVYAAVTGGEAMATVLVMGAYLGVAMLIFAHILAFPGESPGRRMAAAAVDIGTLSLIMLLLGERASPFFLVYV
ncbi:MAG TPA: hypothetical protein VM489_13630, partial [Burkholderiales bacterium]|nr:hypothetical protein [Burkholderiales bacterium]